MAHFQYQARTSGGEMVSGTLAARDLYEASKALRDEEKYVVHLVPTAERKENAAADEGRPGRVTRKDVVSFTHQLAVMIQAGVAITEALDCAYEQSEKAAFREVVADVRRHIEAGGELSLALDAHSQIFPVVMRSLVRASEASGTLGPMMERVSQYLTKEMEAVRKIRGALIYPAIMLGMVLVVTLFLLTVVIPQFTSVYEGKGAALPAPTKMLLATSDSLSQYWYIWVAVLIAAAVGLGLLRKTDTGRRVIDYLKLEAPIIGQIFRGLYVNRGCRTMGLMLGAGVPMLEVVQLTRQVSRNHYVEAMWQRVEERVRTGGQVSEELLRSSLMPKFISQMIASGEHSGRLRDVLYKVAEVTETEFDNRIRTSTQMIEPTLTIVMGAIVGFIALAMLLPIFTVARVVSG